MAMITLQQSSGQGVTVLNNNFIDNYMPEANGGLYLSSEASF